MSGIGNALAPAGASGQPPVSPDLPAAHAPMADTIAQAHAAATAQVKQLSTQRQMMDHLRTELGSLAGLGDAVTPEDVIKGAGMLVGHGADPMKLASLLTNMPQGGEAISGWVQQHLQVINQNEAGLDQQLAAARHSAGVAALHHLAMNHIEQGFQNAPGAGPTPPAPEQPNALTP